MWFRAWGMGCRGHGKPALLGRGVQLPAATHRGGSVRDRIFWSWPGCWWVFPLTWSQEHFPLVTSAYKPQMCFQFLIYFLKEWVKRAAFPSIWLLAGLCWIPQGICGWESVLPENSRSRLLLQLLVYPVIYFSKEKEKGGLNLRKERSHVEHFTMPISCDDV